MSVVDACGCSSFGGDKLAICSQDGVLHLWDVATGAQQQQYTPASHLSSTFTCLSWKISNNRKQATETPKKKKGKLKTGDKFEYIALGTSSGEVMLFDVLAGDLIQKYEGGHTEKVNSICWKSDQKTFYSCSNDRYIIEWDSNTLKHKSKWKADKSEVKRICIGPNSKTLISAGKIIKLWDLKSKELLRKFSGHSSPVNGLSFLNFDLIASNESPLEGVDGSYFVSSATDDRSISIWQVRSLKHKKTALSSLALPSEPALFDVLSPSGGEHQLFAVVATENNEVLVFNQTLNGHTMRPVSASHMIRVSSEEGKPLEVVSVAAGNRAGAKVVTIAYGAVSNLAFEHITIEAGTEKDLILVRKDPTLTTVQLEENNMKLREPIRNKSEITTIVPGLPGHSSETQRKRKKKNSIGKSEMAMEERLVALETMVKPAEDPEVPPSGDSFALLLSQGLQSNDRDILNQVLQHGNLTLIGNTVRQLPLPYVIPLVKDLTERIHGSPDKCLIFIKWIRTTLNTHASYLMTSPGVIPLLSRMYQLMDVRSQTQGRLSRLEGKLDLLMSQVLSRKKNGDSSEEQTALFIYEDESSDEADIDAGNISFDEWENFSENEQEESPIITMDSDNNDDVTI